MKSLLKQGDIVKISCMNGDLFDYPFVFHEAKRKFCNRKATIIAVIPHAALSGDLRTKLARRRYCKDKNGYFIDIDNMRFLWHSSMFEHVLNENILDIF